MMQFAIIARDGTDEDALDRRMQVRPDHLAGARQLKSTNNFVVGGAILNEQGKMTGSIMIVQFETQAEFDDWLKTEPYINGKVWQAIEVHPFKVANV